MGRKQPQRVANKETNVVNSSSGTRQRGRKPSSTASQMNKSDLAGAKVPKTANNDAVENDLGNAVGSKVKKPIVVSHIVTRSRSKQMMAQQVSENASSASVNVALKVKETKGKPKKNSKPEMKIVDQPKSPVIIKPTVTSINKAKSTIQEKTARSTRSKSTYKETTTTQLTSTSRVMRARSEILDEKSTTTAAKVASQKNGSSVKVVSRSKDLQQNSNKKSAGDKTANNVGNTEFAATRRNTQKMKGEKETIVSRNKRSNTVPLTTSRSKAPKLDPKPTERGKENIDATVGTPTLINLSDVVGEDIGNSSKTDKRNRVPLNKTIKEMLKPLHQSTPLAIKKDRREPRARTQKVKW